MVAAYSQLITFARASSDHLDLPHDVLPRVMRRAVRSARATVEALCERGGGVADSTVVVWNIRKLQVTDIDDAEMRAHDRLDLDDAIRCLDGLGLIRRPIPGRPHLIAFLPSIREFELDVPVSW